MKNKFDLPQREIKFREWDKKRKVMLYPKFDDIGNLDWLHHDGKSETDKCVFMQFTGLHDKNGKEIWEGDIINLGDNWWEAAGPAGYDSPIQVVQWNEEHCGFDPFANYDCDCGVYYSSEMCEVIGNVFQNPELLKGKEQNEK